MIIRAVFRWGRVSALPVVLAVAAGAFPPAALGSGEEGMVAIKGHTGEKKYSYMILNPEELKKCVDLGGEMVTLKKELPGLEKKLAQQEEELNAAKTDMDKKKGQAVSKAELDAYNKIVESYNAKVDAYKKDVAKFNGAADKHNDSMEEYKKNCAGWKFYQEDFDALVKTGNK